MFKKWLSILCLMSGVVGTGLAQDATREANPINRSVNPVVNVELTQDGENYELVVKGDLPDGCDFPTITNAERIGSTWFVDLYREVPFSVMCPAMLQSYEERLDASSLFELDANGMPIAIIVVNGKIYGVDNTAVSAPVLTDLWARGPLPYERISITHSEQGDISITLAGTLPMDAPFLFIVQSLIGKMRVSRT